MMMASSPKMLEEKLDVLGVETVDVLIDKGLDFPRGVVSHMILQSAVHWVRTIARLSLASSPTTFACRGNYCIWSSMVESAAFTLRAFLISVALT